MDKLLEVRAYILKFYARYSRYVDATLKFVLALMTFSFVSNHVGYLEALANPVVTIGLSVICIFLPQAMTAMFAALMIIIQFFTLAPGAAIVACLMMLIMFSFYFRFSPGKSNVLLLTPIAFSMRVPVLIPIVFGLVGGPVYAVPITFGIAVYYMVTYVKSYATMIETVAEAGVMEQITAFTEQLFSNKEMWMIIISFTICLLFVYNIRCLEIDYAREIAVVAGVLVHLIMMTFGYVMMDINVLYLELILGSIIAVIIAILLKMFVISVDYSRSEHLQFEDDEYYYYVKAVPKVTVAVPEKTVKKINVRQETEMIDTEEVKQSLDRTQKKPVQEETTKEMQLDESEIQKIIEQELKK